MEGRRDSLLAAFIAARSCRTDVQVFCASNYHLATPGVAAKTRHEQIYLDQRFSDHAPLIIDYDFKL